MKQSHPDQLRILAIDPCTRGFGFAVLEGSEKLIDWGVKEVSGSKNEQSLKRIADLINHFQPDVIVLEDALGKRSRRCRRVRELIADIRALATNREIAFQSFSRSDVRDVFTRFAARTKHQIATTIGNTFPELAPQVPPFRKCWMPEHYSMSVFDSVAFALTFFHIVNSREQAA